ncbi:FAD-dependent oxidoreductase, partial [Nonomuraea rubra]|uniref:FAD-dependent oxidoreductase n=1 Tax=Nonomuraea rubra TaxID=46180 RepID=UPI003CD097CB
MPGWNVSRADLVTDALRASGVDVRFDTTVTAATRGADVRLELSGGEVLHADELLLATGRAPRTDDLGLETVGLRPVPGCRATTPTPCPASPGTGCTPSATSTSAPSSPTRASTRRGSPARSSPTAPATN